jgi:predicted dehydrogenase
MDKVKIGFVGVGQMGQMAHLANYVTNPECEVVAIAEIRPKQARLVAQRYGVPRIYPSHQEMVAAEKLDGIVAILHFDHHAVVLPDLYPKTKHVLTEKPLAVSVQAGQMLADAAARAGCTHMVGYHKRSDPATEYAKSIIDQWRASGELGPMKYVRITMPAGDWVANGMTGHLSCGEPVPPRDAEPPSDLPDDLQGTYRSFVNYYIHQVNLMRHLLGQPYKVVYADKSDVLLAVESSSGVCGVIEMTPYRTTVEWEEQALVAFEKGYLKLDLPAPLAVPHLASHVLGLIARRIRSDWQVKYGHPVHALETFVDPSRLHSRS